MIMAQIYGDSIKMMGQSLDYLWLKQAVTNQNIANADTNGYKAKYVTFEDEFKQALDHMIQQKESKNSYNRNLEYVRPQMMESQAESERVDGNNVNVDVEMMELTRTSLQYQYSLQSVTSDITRLRTVIKG